MSRTIVLLPHDPDAVLRGATADIRQMYLNSGGKTTTTMAAHAA